MVLCLEFCGWLLVGGGREEEEMISYSHCNGLGGIM